MKRLTPFIPQPDPINEADIQWPTIVIAAAGAMLFVFYLISNWGAPL